VRSDLQVMIAAIVQRVNTYNHYKNTNVQQQ